MATFAYPPVVIYGQSRPFAVVTEGDHRAWIYIAAPLGISMTLLSSVMRIFIRAGHRSCWGPDDIMVLISTILSFVQSGLVLAAAYYGFGSSVLANPHASILKAEKFYYASNLLYVLVLGMSRLSVSLFIRRITPIRLHVRVLTTVAGADIVWTLASFLAVALQCNLKRPWVLGHTCANSWFSRWVSLEVTGAVLEATIFLVAACTLVWNLRVPSSKKATITVAFGLRFLVMVIMIAFRLSSFDKQAFQSDPTLHEARFGCWTQAEMNLSIIGATIPIAHRFLASLVTYYGGAGGRNLSHSERGSFDKWPLHAVSEHMLADLSTEKSDSADHAGESYSEEPYMRGARQDVEYSVGVEHRQANEEPFSLVTGGDPGILVRKDVSFKVEYT